MSDQNEHIKSWIHGGCIFASPGFDDKAKLSIAFVFKSSILFFSVRRYLYLEKSQNVQIAFNLLFCFNGFDQALKIVYKMLLF